MTITGYKKYIGSFLEDKYLVFVLANSIDNDLANFDFLFYNTQTGEIADPDYSNFCLNTTNIVSTQEDSFSIALQSSIIDIQLNQMISFSQPLIEYYDAPETRSSFCYFNDCTYHGFNT